MTDRQSEGKNLDQKICPHFGLEEHDITEVADPERRYHKSCRGCGLSYEQFECGRCGTRNPEPNSCRCRTFAAGGIVQGTGQSVLPVAELQRGDHIISHGTAKKLGLVDE